jgi:hypothetical protein
MEDAFETGPDWSDPIKLTSTPVLDRGGPR